MTENKLYTAFRQFAADVKKKLTPPVIGEPEDQLRSPFEQLVSALGEISGKQVTSTGEVSLGTGLGRPDYAVTIDGVLCGYVELKAPGKGADARRFKGHDKAQFEKFKAIPNLLYGDGNHWVLYRNGEQYDQVRVFGDIENIGALAITEADIQPLHRVFSQFLFWEPDMPAGFQQLAKSLAPLCRLLRDDITEALKNPQSKLIQLATDWRKLLFPEATDERFADAYAQTVTFALLLARLDGADVMDLNHAVSTLRAQHTLLSRALQILTDDVAIQDIEPAVRLMQRTMKALKPQLSMGHDDPWLYFYEDFLAAYDEKLRKDYGVYYTPVEVVRCQVRLIDELLRVKLEKDLGFASDGVITLDPAVGTGTYLLGVVDHVLKTVEKKQGPGAVPAHASRLAENLFAFEFMVGPFAVAELRFSRALADRKATLPKQGLSIYLTDTLESPNAQVLDLPQFLRPISDQHKKALDVKKQIPVLVCLGNPPYDRHAAASAKNHGGSGNWVRHGDGNGAQAPILSDFIEPAREAGLGVHIKNLYNLYVYFWRWALWKVFERNDESGPGVVSFITASSYLSGKGFAGMRSHLRKVCDEIWILDLGGEGRGADTDENIFNIQTPVAIGIAFRKEEPEESKPATVRYVKIYGARDEKLSQLDRIRAFKNVKWEICPKGWLDRFVPMTTGDYTGWPEIVNLFPWQHSGVQVKRTWPIAPDEKTLTFRWQALLSASDRAKAFVETRDRKITGSYPQPFLNGDTVAISDVSADVKPPRITRYCYRSLDRQFLFVDNRVCDYLRPQLSYSFSSEQAFFSSLLTSPIGSGPSLMAAGHVPDLHHFSGRGAKDTIPLYRDSAATEPNLVPGLLEQLKTIYKKRVKAEDFFAYCYGVLAHPAFSARFAGDQKRDGVRVPVTKDYSLFRKAATTGRKLIWLHTYGERFVPKGRNPGEIPQGKARCTEAVPDAPDQYPEDFAYDPYLSTLRVGAGAFAPVSQDVWEFEVSGLKVVRSWLGYRMKNRKGKKSSPLDDIHPERWTADFSTELIHLLWILEATIKQYPTQEALFEEILDGPLFTVGELPTPPDWMRKPPKPSGPQMPMEL